MHTTHSETEAHLITAMRYYNAMIKKDFEALEGCLGEDVYLKSPLALVQGKEEVVRAAVLMEFTHQLISKIELFFDARPFEIHEKKIFKNGAH